MTPAQLAAIKSDTELDEGRIPYLYRDSAAAGNATCAIGHLVRDFSACQALPFDPPITAKEWSDVTTQPAGCRASFYATCTKGRLSDAAMDGLFEDDAQVVIAEVTLHIPDYETLPDGPIRALFNMAYNLGMGGLLKFKKLLSAVDRRDWQTCATECHRNGISEERNKRIASLFLSAV